MSNQACLEVFIPAYGPSPYLAECIDSVLANGNYISRCTVIDDCSPTLEIFDIVEKYQGSVEYVRNSQNLGLASTFQKAFELSSSEFTVVMGSDDRMLRDYGLIVNRIAQDFPETCLIHPKVKIINEFGLASYSGVDRVKSLLAPKVKTSKEMLSRDILPRLLIGDWMYFPSIAWNTQVLRNYRLDSNLKTAVDLDLLLRLSTSAESFVIAADYLFEYRRHPQSVSSKLLLDGTRIKEELGVHFLTSSNLRKQNKFLLAFLAYFALTVRLHAVKIGVVNTKGVLPRLNAIALAFRTN